MEPAKKQATGLKTTLYYFPGGYSDKMGWIVPFSMGGYGCCCFALLFARWLKDQPNERLLSLCSSKEPLGDTFLKKAPPSNSSDDEGEEYPKNFFTWPSPEELEVEAGVVAHIKDLCVLSGVQFHDKTPTYLEEGTHVIAISTDFHFLSVRVFEEECLRYYVVLDDANTSFSERVVTGLLCDEKYLIDFDRLPEEIVSLSLSQRHLDLFKGTSTGQIESARELVVALKRERNAQKPHGKNASKADFKTVRSLFQQAKSLLELIK